MLYLLSTDTLAPDKAEAYFALRLALADRTAKPAGLWVPKFGAVSQMLRLERVETVVLSDPAIDAEDAAAGLVRRERQLIEEVKPFVQGTTAGWVYELRVYDLKAGLSSDFLGRMMEMMPVRERYSPNLGIWKSVSGRGEQVLHLYGYSSVEDRDAARKRLKGDQQWSAYISTILPMIENIDSKLLISLIGSRLIKQ